MSCNGLTYATALDGNIAFSCFTQYFNKITVKTGQVLLDVSAFGGSGYQVFIPGIKKLSGTASGFLSTETAANPFASCAYSCGTISITFDVGCVVTFGIYIGEIDIAENYEGTVDITVQWAYSSSVLPSVEWNNAS